MHRRRPAPAQLQHHHRIGRRWPTRGPPVGPVTMPVIDRAACGRHLNGTSRPQAQVSSGRSVRSRPFAPGRPDMGALRTRNTRQQSALTHRAQGTRRTVQSPREGESNTLPGVGNLATLPSRHRGARWQQQAQFSRAVCAAQQAHSSKRTVWHSEPCSLPSVW